MQKSQKTAKGIDFLSKVFYNGKTRVDNLRWALLEEGLHLAGDEEWAEKRRSIRSMSLAEVRQLPISRLLFEGYAKRTMTIMKIKTVGELLDYPEAELKQRKDIGDDTFNVILFHLEYFGLKLRNDE